MIKVYLAKLKGIYIFLNWPIQFIQAYLKTYRPYHNCDAALLTIIITVIFVAAMIHFSEVYIIGLLRFHQNTLYHGPSKGSYKKMTPNT